jgi:hypothetical protein
MGCQRCSSASACQFRRVLRHFLIRRLIVRLGRCTSGVYWRRKWSARSIHLMCRDKGGSSGESYFGLGTIGSSVPQYNLKYKESACGPVQVSWLADNWPVIWKKCEKGVLYLLGWCCYMAESRCFYFDAADNNLWNGIFISRNHIWLYLIWYNLLFGIRHG